MSDCSTPSYAAICSRIHDNALIAAECQHLTGGTPDPAGVARCETVSQIPHASYVQTGIRLLASGRTLEELVTAVERTEILADAFRIEIHTSAERYCRSRRATIIALADALPYRPNLDDPTHRFLLCAHDGRLWFGEIVSECQHSYEQHDDKPCRTSFSLPSRLSRTLVNLITPAQTLYDPCCGTGSILLEAQARGIEAYGVDWNEAMVQMTRENVAKFGYEAHVVNADARTYTQSVDAVVTDLPYGQFLESETAVIRAILEQGATLAPVAVYVAGAPIPEWLETAGYHDVTVYPVVKRTGFVRYIHLAESDHYKSSTVGSQPSERVVSNPQP